MAASARWFGKIRAALGNGASAPKVCTCQALKELPPPGHVITSAGIIVPVKYINRGLNGSGRLTNWFEREVIERIENWNGLYFRLTAVIVSAGACHFAIKLTWYESTEKGRLYYYLPGPDEDVDVPLQAPAAGSPSAQSVIDEVKALKLAKFNEGCLSACNTGELISLFENVVREHNITLMSKGLQRETIADAQSVFLTLVKDAAKNCLLQSSQNREASVARQQKGGGCSSEVKGAS